MLKTNKSVEKIQAQAPISLKEVLKSIAFSNIERYKTGIISLFFCHVSANCNLPELKKYRNPIRITIDSKSKTIKIWRLMYNARKPDITITNALTGS